MPPPEYLPLSFEPGLWRNGTVYQARGRWYDANLMRWANGGLGPIGGWRPWGESTTAVTGVPRTALVWMDNSNNRWLAAGTAANLYVYDSSATRYDITPSPFTAGNTDADPNTGYGDWLYGKSTYGDERPDIGIPVPATIWALDTWGEDLVGCTPDDGKLYLWDTSVGTGTVAAQLANSPIYCISTLVTPERIQMAFGGVASGGSEANADRRKIFWSDIENNTIWAATSTNAAGDHTLNTTGDLLGGIKVRGQILIFTTDDVHTASYVGQPYIYQFNQVGNQCGRVCANAGAVAINTAYWMGRSAQGFFSYDGYMRSIPCDVEDYVISQINNGQASKVQAWHNTLYTEIVWFYPSGTEIDSYVAYNYVEDHWSVGTLARTATTSRGIFNFPIMFDSSGNPYEHEVGGTYQDTGDDAIVPYVESGPIELGNGNRTMSATGLIPDVTALGDITTSFYTRMYPTDSDTEHGPFTMTQPTSVRFTGRTVRMRCTSDSANAWKVGVPRLKMQAGGKR